MLVLYQTEWCPYSHRVRMRLTELCVEWLARPVSVDRAGRAAMQAVTGTRSIPTLVDDDAVVTGASDIIAHLESRYETPPDAHLHAEKLARDEWPHWLELHGSGSGTPGP